MSFLQRFLYSIAARGYKPPSEEFSFENLDGADRIEVTTNLNTSLKVIDDSQVIGQVVDWVKTYPDRWTVPFDGVPVARVRMNFYKGDRIVGNVGIDDEFLTTMNKGSFWSRQGDVTARVKVFQIIGLDDYPQEA
ncbi:MAG: hypothetical protein WCF84_19485 [Anaerolineae bacterium]